MEGTFSRVHNYLTLRRRDPMFNYFIKTPIYVALILSVVMMTYPPNSVKRYKLSAVSIIILFFVLLFIVDKIGFVGNKGVPKVVFNSGTTIVFISVLLFCSVLLNRLFRIDKQLPHYVTIVLSNPLMKFIGVGYYMIDLTLQESTESGVIAGSNGKTLTDIEYQWVLLALLLDKIALLAYLLYLISVYT